MIPNTLLAFEVLMQETPYSHFDSGCDGITPECRTCRFHRPHWKYQACVFQFCPYSPIFPRARKSRGGDTKWQLSALKKTKVCVNSATGCQKSC